MKEQARRNADTPSGKEIGGLGMDSWVRWGVPAAAIAITLPAYAYQYSTVGAAQQQAFPGARFEEIQPQRVWKALAVMSFHDEGSDVSRLNRGAYETAIRVHPWTFEVLEIALDLHSRSNGMFDIRIAPALQKLGLLPYHGGDLAGMRREFLAMAE
ncbi:MAG: hypothetical protein USCAAHI_00011 [Beijerinckiaceae bacterium]|nr:MAG: hypothetical protein USCAAHI_00011 [Beijerinckiaceae bacterium]